MQPLHKAAFGAALFAATLTGGALGATVLTGAANAQTGTTTAPTAAPAAPDPSSSSAPSQAPSQAPTQAPPQHDPSQAGHAANGITETLLTGDDAAKATAAAQAAVPGATIERVETDAEGDAYEAHVVKADGTHATVKMAADFSVTKVEDGPAGRPAK